MLFYKKLIKSGDIVEIFEYENPVRRGKDLFRQNNGGRSGTADEVDKLENRKLVMQRARTTLRRLVSANAYQWMDQDGKPFKPKFVTLTFAENITDIKSANYEFKKFRERLSYDIGKKPEYVVVTEFQKRGAIHYHTIFFNLPYIKSDKLAELWGQGFVRINKVDEVDNVGAYVCKYMGKNIEDDRLVGKKSYFTSRGLFKPLEIVKEKEINQVATELSPTLKTYENTFDSDYFGKINYTQYNIKNKL